MDGMWTRVWFAQRTVESCICLHIVFFVFFLQKDNHILLFWAAALTAIEKRQGFLADYIRERHRHSNNNHHMSVFACMSVLYFISCPHHHTPHFTLPHHRQHRTCVVRCWTRSLFYLLLLFHIILCTPPPATHLYIPYIVVITAFTYQPRTSKKGPPPPIYYIPTRLYSNGGAQVVGQPEEG